MEMHFQGASHDAAPPVVRKPLARRVMRRALPAVLLMAAALGGCGLAGGGDGAADQEAGAVGEVLSGAGAARAAATATAVAAAPDGDSAIRRMPGGVTLNGSEASNISGTYRGVTACLPSGVGTDYQVGPGKALASLDQVPWERLRAGDTVRFFPSAVPYSGKFLISAQGTATAPVRICGVRDTSGKRPVIDGSGARSRPALSAAYGLTTEMRDLQQARAIAMIKSDASVGRAVHPRFIQIDGLKFTRGHPDQTFYDVNGAARRYAAFSACIWVDQGHDITIADNEVTDCAMALFSKSTDEGDYAVTRRLRVAGNLFSGHGISGEGLMHTTYTQSVGTVIESNTYGPMRAGAGGASLKDRSSGLVVRNNFIEGGSRALDLVEAEDYPRTALATPDYRMSFVHGNRIRKVGDTGSVIHYGGDHMGSKPGASWGEPVFRGGMLYFYENTVVITGRWSMMFQLSTQNEKAAVWNNIFVYADTVQTRNFRMSQEVGPPWVSGGEIHLGDNWISTGWVDTDSYHKVGGRLIGAERFTVGQVPPVDMQTLLPLPGAPAGMGAGSAINTASR